MNVESTQCQNTTVVPFEFDGFNVRVLWDGADPWFVAKDVAETLGYLNPRKAIRDHCKGVNETFLPTAGGAQAVKLIPEADLYRLIMRSRLPSAERFSDWVHETVLPAVRKSEVVPAQPKDAAPSLSPRDMQAIGGMLKGVLNKALTETVPALVSAQLASQELGIVHGVSALDVAKMAGVKDRRGLRGLGNVISNRLRRFHAEKGVPVKVRDYGSMASVYSYDKATSKEWLMNGGKQEIERYVQERRGQSHLHLVCED